MGTLWLVCPSRPHRDMCAGKFLKCRLSFLLHRTNAYNERSWTPSMSTARICTTSPVAWLERHSCLGAAPLRHASACDRLQSPLQLSNEVNSVNPAHSALTEAEDLAALLTGLDLRSVHLVGASYGAYTALALALRRPDLVRSLVLAEPPLIHWLPEVSGGQAVYNDFFKGWWRPVAAAFKASNVDGALKTAIDWWGSHGAAIGAEPLHWENLPEEYRQILRENANDLGVRLWRQMNVNGCSTSRPVSRLQCSKTTMPVRARDTSRRCVGAIEPYSTARGSHS
jgi:hypothetical protein